MFEVSNTVRRTKTEDGGVLLDVRLGRIFSLNVVGFRILDLLEQGFDTAQIAAELSKRYGMDLETVRADVREFIGVLNKHHILHLRSQVAAGGPVCPHDS
jgi:DNA-binding CsgD family transcriptional regulator